ncbi:MAG TPA: DUF4956 domain-containing protein [Gemmatimonadaceae bacterium]|nr:DUF4956 domain-containing protein [Gemmatimonadaceae bacterium]
MASGRTSGAARQAGRVAIGVPLRVIAYYAVLALAVALAVRWLPPVTLSELLEPRGATESASTAIPAEVQGGVAATVAMMAAALLTLPVAWIYTLTHERRGFRQSVVHTLMLLPVVVAGVVVLVKNSIPLAFSLAGIVAAVRFRNTLEDSKDAVYIFLATGVGLAAGVSLPVAAALSIVFNILIVTLWLTDFARTPARTAARDARRRLERSLAAANRTGEFIARLDADLLSKLPPTQLEALADRAWRRRKRAAPELDGLGKNADTLLRLRTTDVARLRPLIEPVLDARAKRVRYGGVVHEPNGVDWIEYRVGLRRSETADGFLTALRDAGGELIDDAEIRR